MEINIQEHGKMIKKDGRGVYQISDGSKTLGNWKNGKINGQKINYLKDVAKFAIVMSDSKENGNIIN